ncbi:hypothetical protein TREMEDRAFT_15682, partial [Tremella mesenterica DSM 1558]|uniref:uncharacterized protein n=1 Tax=Tremella mesenterica (strain ATCC 24925 / CBS 8224 / DSM 1558 / NBRC 9311 / NRRL Y-6157 / RJB 2259-6 / UBC 559-6) TaxID=578456 RepID=UPI00032BE0C8
LNPTLTLPTPLILGISPSTSHTLSFIFASSYVGCIYLATHITFPSFPSLSSQSENNPTSSIPPMTATDKDGYPLVPPIKSRDHPDTIKRRMKAISITTLISLGSIWIIVKDTSHGKYTWTSSLLPTLRLLGLDPSLILNRGGSIWSNVIPYVLTPILFVGPIYAKWLDSKDQPQPRRSFSQLVQETCEDFDLIALRNYVVGPMTEELVFRSCILSVSILGGLSSSTLVFGTPLWFSLAHAHHAWESYRRNGSTRRAAIQATMGCLFQIGYTTLFGWFASYSFIRTGSILPPLASHIFCNIMSIYLPTTAVERHPKRKLSIWTSYLIGIAGFAWTIRYL